jgi:hypothetical protein
MPTAKKTPAAKKSAAKSSTAKTQPTSASVAGFIAAVADPTRRADCEELVRLMRRATGAEPVMWGAAMVGFGTYRYVYASGRSGDWPVVAFSPRKQDLTVYLMAGFDALGPLLQRLGKHKTGSSCLYLEGLADIDRGVLAEMIDASVAAMASQRIDRPAAA